MKKTLLASLLTVLGCALSSQAVVIGWSGENAPVEATSAILVYVSSGTPTYDGTLGTLETGETVGTAVSGGALFFTQETEDAVTRSSGSYYLVLFKGGYYDQQYMVSSTSLTWDDDMISTDPDLDPISDYFAPAFGETWSNVPEPSTAMLLVAGAAVAALRRRKQQA
ncbi:MAG: PEP-CTERM sorting domain-containing protein [Kiritimatiellae bacterium]|nr:PEP-CTERM sorting domain-containing protein [Kiritimatiellia bacterium]